jgi:predicted metal-dependent hydrolase
LRALLRRILQPAPLEPASILVDGTAIPVKFRRNAKAKRLIVRIDPAGSGVVATVPARTSRATALAFVEKSRDWIRGRLAKQVRPAPLDQIDTLPLRGTPHRLNFIGKPRCAILADALEAALIVPGDPAHRRRRLLDWLKREAKRDLAAASSRYAELMGVTFKRLSVRDQKSRWGSCSAAGDLSYSWRLILAPPHVLDYVAAHEVAHLKEMNHGPRFWRLVLAHCPDAAKARDWLKRNAAELHRYR